MSNFEAPMQEGPLVNPEWTDEENRRYDVLEDIETPATARIRALQTSENHSEELAEIESAAAEIVKKTIKPKPKRPINSPSRNHRIYDRDKTVESIYGKPGEL